jgi:hypothetical protein
MCALLIVTQHHWCCHGCRMCVLYRSMEQCPLPMCQRNLYCWIDLQFSRYEMCM